MKHRFISFLSVLFALFAPAAAFAQYGAPYAEPFGEPPPPPPEEESHHHSDGDGFGARFGIGINWFTNYKHTQTHDFVSGNIPTLDIDIPLVGRYFQFTIGWREAWGITKFYAKGFFPMLGLRLYPFGNIFSVYGKGGWGTFLFNDSTLRGEGGVGLDIPIHDDGDDTVFISPTAGYFYERAWRLADFIQQDQWRMKSPGWIFGIELVVRRLD